MTRCVIARVSGLMITRRTSPQKPSEQLALAPIVNSAGSAIAASFPVAARWSLAGQHGGGLALEVEVGFAADVHGDPLNGATGEPVRVLAGVVVGNGRAAIAADAQALAGELEVAGLGLDPALADLAVTVVQGQDAGGYAGRVLAVLVERRGQDEVLPRWQVFGGADLLLEHADEVVGIVQ